MPGTRSRYLLVLCGFGLLAAGCAPVGTTVRHDRRAPAHRPSDRPVSHRADRAYGRLEHDARRHVRALDRALHLDRRQERRIERLLAERAADYLRRARPRDWDRANPFPRRYGERATRAWWHGTDRRIERELNPRQRHAYRSLVRRAEHRDRRRSRDNRHRWDDDGDG